MAKSHEETASPHGTHAHGAHAHGESKPKPGLPRIIPEYTRPEEGMTLHATRLADFPAEAEAGWHRYKVLARVPHEAAHPPEYVLAPDREAAEKAYREKHGLAELAPEDAKKLQTLVRELPD